MKTGEAPPPLAEVLVRSLIPRGHVRSSILGDLREEFGERAEREGLSAARRWYWRQAVTVFGNALRDRLAGRSWSRPNDFGGEYDPRHHTAGGGKGFDGGQPLADLRFALRQLVRRPGLAAITVFTLALGIGANTVVFSVVNGVLLKPLPYGEPDRLVSLWNTASGLGMSRVDQAAALHFTYLEEASSFRELGLWTRNSVTMSQGEEPTRVEAVWVTDGTLRALDVQPHLGRWFSPEEDSPGSPRTVILSHGIWQAQFAGDPHVLGQTVTIEGGQVEIVGVMPPGFGFLDSDPALLLPLQFDLSRLTVDGFSFRSLGRLAPGVTVEAATAELDRLVPAAIERFPGGMTLETRERAEFSPRVIPLAEEVVGDVGPVLWVLMGAMAITLLIACANVANLFLVRTEDRKREVAIRTAIGASKGQVARQFLTESMLLGLIGGVVGLGLAMGGLHVLKSLAVDHLPRLPEVTLDPFVLLFTLGISILVGLLLGLLPVLTLRKLSPMASTRAVGGGSGRHKEHHRLSNTLVVGQMALALVLLTGSGLMVRSFAALTRVNPGFQAPEEVLTFRLNIPSVQARSDVDAARLLGDIASAIGEIPGVTGVGLSSSITMDGLSANSGLNIEDFPSPDGGSPPSRRFKFIGPGYFATMRNEILAGRDISWDDIHNLNPVVVVTENLARTYWRTPSEALGKRVFVGRTLAPGSLREIVGVVGNIHDDGMRQAPTPTVFWPMVTPNPWPGDRVEEPVRASRSMAFAVRSPEVASGNLLHEVRQAIWSVNPNLALSSVQTLEEIQGRSLARTSFTLVLLLVAAGMAMILGAVGLYGVISHLVSRRTGEIGVRMSLGADAGNVRWMVLRHGLWLILTGVTAGVVAALGLTRFLDVLLFGVEPLDPSTFGAVAIFVVFVALLATYLPAHRASQIDPVDAIRFER